MRAICTWCCLLGTPAQAADAPARAVDAPTRATDAPPEAATGSAVLPRLSLPVTPDTPARSDPNHRNGHPDYPPAAVAAREQGRTVLEIYIDASGAVADAVVRSSSGSPRLDQAALDGVTARGDKAWRYLPARLGGRPIAVWQLVSIQWDLATVQGPVLSPAVGKSLLAAQTALQVANFQQALLAVDQAERGAKLPRDHFQVSEMRANIYVKQQDFGRAADAIETSLALGLMPAPVRDLRVVQVCQMRYATQAYATALVACQHAIEVAGPDVKAYTTLGLIARAQRRYRESAAAVQSALDLKDATTNVEALLQLQFNNYRDLSDVAAQRRVLELLIARRPDPEYAERLRLLPVPAVAAPGKP